MTRHEPTSPGLMKFWLGRQTQSLVYCLYNGARSITVNTKVASTLSITDILSIPPEVIAEALLCFGCKPRFRCLGDEKFSTDPEQRKALFYVFMHDLLPIKGERRPRPLVVGWSYGSVMGHLDSLSTTDDTYLAWLVRLKDAASAPLSPEQDRLKKLTRLDRFSLWIKSGLGTVPICLSPVKIWLVPKMASWVLEGAKVTKLTIQPAITVWALYYIHTFWVQYGQTFLSRYEKFRKAYYGQA